MWYVCMYIVVGIWSGIVSVVRAMRGIPTMSRLEAGCARWRRATHDAPVSWRSSSRPYIPHRQRSISIPCAKSTVLQNTPWEQRSTHLKRKHFHFSIIYHGILYILSFKQLYIIPLLLFEEIRKFSIWISKIFFVLINYKSENVLQIKLRLRLMYM